MSGQRLPVIQKKAARRFVIVNHHQIHFLEFIRFFSHLFVLVRSWIHDDFGFKEMRSCKTFFCFKRRLQDGIIRFPCNFFSLLCPSFQSSLTFFFFLQSHHFFLSLSDFTVLPIICFLSLFFPFISSFSFLQLPRYFLLSLHFLGSSHEGLMANRDPTEL